MDVLRLAGSRGLDVGDFVFAAKGFPVPEAPAQVFKATALVNGVTAAGKDWREGEESKVSSCYWGAGVAPCG